ENQSQKISTQRIHSCDWWECPRPATITHVARLHGAQERYCLRCFRAVLARERVSAVRDLLFTPRPRTFRSGAYARCPQPPAATPSPIGAVRATERRAAAYA